MYHWNLSSAIRFFGALVFLYVLFQTWLQPTDFDPNQLEPIESPSPESPNPQPAINTPPSPLELDASFDTLQARLINPGKPPSAKLERILHDFDQKHYQDVETQLQELPQQMLASDHVRHFAAAIWNNVGVYQEQSFGIEISVNAFKQAVALAPHNPIALLNLTQAYWGLHDAALTPAFLESVLRVAPHDAFTHIALADLLLENGKMAEAEQHLKLAQAQALADPSLKTYFQQLTGKLDHQRITGQTEPSPDPAQPVPLLSNSLLSAQTESQRSPTVTGKSTATRPVSAPNGETSGKPRESHSVGKFTIIFDGKPNPDMAMRIRSILEYASEDISNKFGYTPTTSIQVVLHTEQPFTIDAGNPGGADDLYDHGSATIHLPVGGTMEDLAVLSRALRHEFAHAFLHDKMHTHINQLPTWVVEGLAIQLAEDPWPALEEIKQKPFSVISLPALEKQWDPSHKDKLSLAYLESASAVQSLVDRHGMYGIRQVMNVMQAGQTFEGAMKQKWSLSYDQFQRDWEKAFTASMGRD